jgi:hypothetical protein
VTATNPASRMCLRTSGGALAGGYRCGAATGLDNATWERVVLGSSSAVSAAVPAPAYAPVGPQTDVPAAALVGWTVCHASRYSSSSQLGAMLAGCPATYLMLACRPMGSATYSLLAWAPRADALWNAGTSATSSRLSNGAQWYYSDSWSWGFAGAGDAVNRSEW